MSMYYGLLAALIVLLQPSSSHAAKLRTLDDELGVCAYGQVFGPRYEVCMTSSSCYANYNLNTGYMNFGWRPTCRGISKYQNKEAK
jgi:hypothetical protein